MATGAAPQICRICCKAYYAGHCGCSYAPAATFITTNNTSGGYVQYTAKDLEKQAKQMRQTEKDQRATAKAYAEREARRRKDREDVRKALRDVMKNSKDDQARIDACEALLLTIEKGHA
jgi:hypothetical protein